MTTRRLVMATLVAAAGLAGCELAPLIGGMAQNFEYQKLVEVHPAYYGLENKRVAVVVDVDYTIMYEHAEVPLTIGSNLSRRIARYVPGATVIHPNEIANWQFRTSNWHAMPYGEMAEALNAERIVLVDVSEYRLHPPGNRWLWEGVCLADVHVIEPDGIDPDLVADSFLVEATYPKISGVGRDSATASAIQIGVLEEFVREAGWLFFRHLEPKHPDHYNGPPPDSRLHELYEGDEPDESIERTEEERG